MSTTTNYDSAIAIVGMSGRFPGANTVEQLWDNLTAGRPGLRLMSDEELARAGVSPGTMANPNYVRYAAPVDDIDLFDAPMFGFSRREAETMEPQHRVFLECAWEAVESAGYAPNDTPGKVGVFAGCGFPDYMLNVLPLTDEPGGKLLLAVGVERDSLASLVSYKLDLRGPSLTVQTFCSTSLVATHLAAQSLLNFECDMAIAGGAYLALPQTAGYLYEEGGITTPDGRIRSFDAAARGTVLGNGVAVVTLKRMTDALADGDPIQAVILGSAVNNDGRACAGYTAPGVDGQAEVIELALGVADVKSETIGYVECHATGTQLGDSIELTALSRVFQRPPATPAVLSTLKPSIGHLDRASGVAGLIRTTMALRNRMLPGTPGFETPNAVLAGAADRFRVIPTPEPWPAGDHPRRAGISSFGFGGTNAHVVVEEAPEVPASPPRPGPHLLVLSARDLNALYAGIEKLRLHIDRHREQDLADVAYTLQQSRTSFLLRWAVVCADHDDAVAALADPSRWLIGEAERTNGPVRLRLPAADTLSEQRWAELAEALAGATAPQERIGRRNPAVGPVHQRAAEAAAELLTRLGVRMAAIVCDDPADDTATRLATEFAVTAQADDVATDAEFPLEPLDSESADEWLRTALALLWQAGTKLDWSALHHQGTPRRLALPTYAFQRQRYWVDLSEGKAKQVEVPTGKIHDAGQWTYLASWRQQHLRLPDLDDRLREAGPWLVLGADEHGDALVDRLTAAGAEVTMARPGAAFGPATDGGYLVRPDSADDLAALLATVPDGPRTIVHGFTLAGGGSTDDPVRRFDTAQSTGFHSVMALATALERAGFTEPVGLVLLTDGAVEVAGGDLERPEHATLSGLAPVLAQENPTLSCRHVDVDTAGSTDRLAGRVLAEAVTEHQGPVAWRGHQRWLRAYEPAPLPPADPAASRIAPGSTVLITGGLGNVGLLLSRHLASTRGCKLVLTARSALPPRDRWADRLAAAGPDDKVARYLRRVLDLEAEGAEVLAMSADVADGDAMAAVVRAAEERFGGIDAVVHAAGVQDAAFFGLAHTLDRATCDAHLRAKVHGFHHLQRLLAGRVTGPRITLSSLSAVLGGISFAPYAAANAALDAYALAARHTGDGAWVSVDWDAWQDITAIDAASEEPKSTVSTFEMAPDEGIDVFERALTVADEVGRLVISTGVLDARLAQWVTRAGGEHDGGADTGPVEPRPALSNPFVAPTGPVETTLAEIWAAVLRYEQVGVDDDFYLLGGDSIVAIELIARIRKALRVAVPVTALLEDGTVRRLAVRLATS